MDHLTVADYPTKSYIVFSSGDTIGIEMKKIGRKTFLIGTCQIHTFHQTFPVPMPLFPTMRNMIK